MDRALTNWQSVTRYVSDFYDMMPYPLLEYVFRDHTALPLLRYGAQLFRYMPNWQPKRILSAGCGIIEAVQLAINFPTASVIGIDISSNALNESRKIANRFGIKNLTLINSDLKDVSSLSQSFDLISCVGVLHHVADPVLALNTLRNCLNRHGVIELMLYSHRNRYWIEELREYIRTVYKTSGDLGAPRIKQWLTENLSVILNIQTPENRLKAPLERFLGIIRRYHIPEEIVDALMHPYVRTYTLEDCGKLLERTKLSFINFKNGWEWGWRFYAYNSPPPWHDKSPLEDQYKIIDLLFAPGYFIYARHADSISTNKSWQCPLNLNNWTLILRDLEIANIHASKFTKIPVKVKRIANNKYIVQMTHKHFARSVITSFSKVGELIKLTESKVTFNQIKYHFQRDNRKSQYIQDIEKTIHDLIRAQIIIPV